MGGVASGALGPSSGRMMKVSGVNRPLLRSGNNAEIAFPPRRPMGHCLGYKNLVPNSESADADREGEAQSKQPRNSVRA